MARNNAPDTWKKNHTFCSGKGWPEQNPASRGNSFGVGHCTYLFIKNGAVIRRDSIIDIVRMTSHYKMVPTAVFLSAKVKDENGSMSLPLCRVHMLKADAVIEEIRKAVLQRH